MSINSFNEKNSQSIDSLSEDNIFTSQNTQSKSQRLTNINAINKDENNNSNHNSDEDESFKNKEIISLNLPPKNNLNSNEIIENEPKGQNEKKSLALSLSPLKKTRRRRNSLIDIMEKSKKHNNARRRSVINYPSQEEIKLKDEISKNERKDAFGIPINKRNKRKIKVTFSDMVINQKGPKTLAEVIPIASFKKYNYIEGTPREEDIINNTSKCQCCLIN
jgi:hypothetical protein